MAALAAQFGIWAKHCQDVEQAIRWHESNPLWCIIADREAGGLRWEPAKGGLPLLMELGTGNAPKSGGARFNAWLAKPVRRYELYDAFLTLARV